MSELIMDIDALLDGTIDDLADMPEFKPFSAGAHKAILRFEQKKIDDTKAGVEISMTIQETLELADPTNSEPMAKGDSTSVFLFLKHPNAKTVELGQGQFKEILKVLVAKFGEGKSPRQLMEEANGGEAIIVTDIRTMKAKDGNPERKFTQLKQVMYE